MKALFFPPYFPSLLAKFGNLRPSMAECKEAGIFFSSNPEFLNLFGLWSSLSPAAEHSKTHGAPQHFTIVVLVEWALFILLFPFPRNPLAKALATHFLWRPKKVGRHILYQVENPCSLSRLSQALVSGYMKRRLFPAAERWMVFFSFLPVFAPVIIELFFLGGCTKLPTAFLCFWLYVTLWNESVHTQKDRLFLLVVRRQKEIDALMRIHLCVPERADYLLIFLFACGLFFRQDVAMHCTQLTDHSKFSLC